MKTFWDANYIIQKLYHNLIQYGKVIVIWLFNMSQYYNKYTNNHYTDVCFFQSLIHITYALLYITSNNFTKSSAKQTCLDILECGQKIDIT